MNNKLSLFFITLLAIAACKDTSKDRSNEQTVSFDKELPVENYIYSTIISKKGEIVFEQYYNGKIKDSLCDVQSLTKGLVSILIGIAIDKEYIKNENVPIKVYFRDEYAGLTDKNKENISIKHLLNQTSGLSWKGYLEHENWLNSEDPISYVLQKELENNPGEKYNYNSGATHLLSVILSRTTGKTTLEFADAFLFNHLNISLIDWQKRGKGYYDGSGFGLKMRPMDLMKIGQLLESNGKFNEVEIISEQWVQKLFNENEKSATEWGLRNSKHGFCWYSCEFAGNKINYGMGYGGQFILLIPDIDLIIVTTHNHDTPDGIDQQIKFLNKKLPQLIKEYGS